MMIFQRSLIAAVFCIAAVQCDVSHLLGAPSPVDSGTIEVLRRNISDYLVELEHGGSPQMLLKQIFQATKQTVAGTLYTVQALLDTPDGPKKCEVRVLEKPWLDFCQVRVTCENGGHYEVTINPNQIDTNHLNLPPLQPAPFVPLPKPPQPPQSFNYQPQPQHVPAPFVPTQAPQHKPTFQTFPVSERLPFFDFKPVAPTPASQTTPVHTAIHPQPAPAHQVHHDGVAHNILGKGEGVPKPVFPPSPHLNVLSFDKLPHGEQLHGYLEQLFSNFMIKYNRQYIDEPNEKAHRFAVFIENFHTMHEHAKSDNVFCEYSVTEFSDLTKDEFGRITGFDTSALNGTEFGNDDDFPTSAGSHSDSSFGSNAGGSQSSGQSSSESSSSGANAGDLPEKYDLRDENLVTRVKYQGDCGACWAFVATAVIESLCAKRTKKLQEFSEQSLIDCDDSNYGCKGGVPPNAMKHIAKRGGLELEAVYPYVFEKSTCKFNKANVKVKVAGVVGFPKGEEQRMAKWLMTNGPIWVGLNSAPLQFYKGGILNPTPELCNPKKIDHGVTLIGFGVEKKGDKRLSYWIAKNQWGTRWGEDGYFRIARGTNACGLALYAASAKLADVPNNCQLEGA